MGNFSGVQYGSILIFQKTAGAKANLQGKAGCLTGSGPELAAPPARTDVASHCARPF